MWCITRLLTVGYTERRTLIMVGKNQVLSVVSRMPSGSQGSEVMPPQAGYEVLTIQNISMEDNQGPAGDPGVFSPVQRKQNKEKKNVCEVTQSLLSLMAITGRSGRSQFEQDQYAQQLLRIIWTIKKFVVLNLGHTA